MPSASEGPVLGDESPADGPVVGRKLTPPAPGCDPGPGRLEAGRAATGTGRRPADPSRSAAEVLADRIAAALVHHEPGWRLPRHTALARRYNVSTAEIEVALEQLAARHLIRRLPDGQLYRLSPAEYLIPIEGVPGLGSRADPMGGEIVCRSRQVSERRPPEDISWALRVPPAEQVRVVRVQWTVADEPAAFSTTYLLKDIAAPFLDSSQDSDSAAGRMLLPVSISGGSAGEPGEMTAVGAPGAVHLEMRPPPPSVARGLRLAAGQPAALVTVRFDDPEQHRPVALTMAVFRPDLFRIVVQSSERPPLAERGDAGVTGAWAHAAEDWEAS